MIQIIVHVVMHAPPLLDQLGVGVGEVVGRSACLTGHAYHKRVLHVMHVKNTCVGIVIIMHGDLI